MSLNRDQGPQHAFSLPSRPKELVLLRGPMLEGLVKAIRWNNATLDEPQSSCNVIPNTKYCTDGLDCE